MPDRAIARLAFLALGTAALSLSLGCYFRDGSATREPMGASSTTTSSGHASSSGAGAAGAGGAEGPSLNLGGAGGFDLSGQVPDFHLPDVNATSTTFGTLVSPRDHLGHVSAWYFGHST